ncbi:MAG: FeoA family protein [Fimbriimonadaceae bacterium]|jgi:ferrous iron transport protein A
MDATFGFEKLKKGMKARVAAVLNQDPDTVRLMELGLTPGTEFTVTKIAPLGDPIEINVRGFRLCLRRRESDGLRLELVK